MVLFAYSRLCRWWHQWRWHQWRICANKFTASFLKDVQSVLLLDHEEFIRYKHCNPKNQLKIFVFYKIMRWHQWCYLFTLFSWETFLGYPGNHKIIRGMTCPWFKSTYEGKQLAANLWFERWSYYFFFVHFPHGDTNDAKMETANFIITKRDTFQT